jgi:hypothetical protein
MPSESDKVPAGWYPAPNGGQRYWDGERWLALPNPDNSTVATDSPAKAVGGRKKVVVASVVVIILAAAGIGAFLISKNNHDTQMRNAAIAASSSKAAADKAAADAEADRVRSERAKRTAAVRDLEADVKTFAQKQSAEGLFDGPVLSVKCDPVGGSTDDLTAQTTILECFVATTDNGDGTFSGEKYHARMNWTTGEETYGYGPPR